MLEYTSRHKKSARSLLVARTSLRQPEREEPAPRNLFAEHIHERLILGFLWPVVDPPVCPESALAHLLAVPILQRIYACCVLEDGTELVVQLSRQHQVASAHTFHRRTIMSVNIPKIRASTKTRIDITMPPLVN
jgi:hypothetical protein